VPIRARNPSVTEAAAFKCITFTIGGLRIQMLCAANPDKSPIRVTSRESITVEVWYPDIDLLVLLIFSDLLVVSDINIKSDSLIPSPNRSSFPGYIVNRKDVSSKIMEGVEWQTVVRMENGFLQIHRCEFEATPLSISWRLMWLTLIHSHKDTAGLQSAMDS